MFKHIGYENAKKKQKEYENLAIAELFWECSRDNPYVFENGKWR